MSKSGGIILNVFLSSPEDVRDERELLDIVIDELNQTWGKERNITLKLTKLEKFTPGIDEYPQSVNK